jgi:epoxyqueuosine reductase
MKSSTCVRVVAGYIPCGERMSSTNQIQDPAGWLERIIRDFINGSFENRLRSDGDEKAWAEPLIGFSCGEDSLYDKLKEDIGPFYWTPLEIFALTFPDLIVKPEELSVISWVLPQTERTKSDNRKETSLPSERWVRSRNRGEEINMMLARHVVARLKEVGPAAVVPGQSPHWKWQTSERYGFSSNWSERHTAFVAGLGTFGLCDGLITEKGKAMRAGSVVARIKIPPTHRPYDHHRSYCLFYTSGTCKKCIGRCPAGAISEKGHDKQKCRDYLFGAVTNYARSTFGFESYGCGLCQTGMPCESRIPLNRTEG